MRAIFVVLLFATQSPAADPPARVKVELLPKDGAWVGQRVTLAITLYTPDFFASVPSFEIPAISGVVVLPPAGSALVGSESVGGTTFTTQRHEFALYSQRSGRVHVPAFPIHFESNAGFGMPVIKRTVTTEATTFEAHLPPGAEGLGLVIAARDLRGTSQWTPEPKSPQVGDAFTLSITVTAPNVPGMVFPLLLPSHIDGLAAYPKSPSVNDRTERGELTGTRTDTVTLVCERPGSVVIPDRKLTWFDLESKQQKSIEFPGRTFVVAPTAPPASAAEETPLAPESHSRWWRIVVLGGVVLSCWWGIVLVWAESELDYYMRFMHACHGGEPHPIAVSLLKWLERTGPLSLEEFDSRYGDVELHLQLAALSESAYGRLPTSEFPAHGLFRAVSHARSRLHRESKSGTCTRSTLPPLNP